ncbi:MAG: hypothetical protein WCL54_07620 [Clostridia bacterium]
MQRKELILKSLLVVALYFGITYLLSLNNYLFGRDSILFDNLKALPFILRDFFVTHLYNLILIATCLAFFIFFKIFMNRHKSFANINDLLKLAGLFVLAKGLYDSLVFLSNMIQNIYLLDRPAMDFRPNSLSVFTILFELLFGFALFFIFRKDAFAQENDKDTFRYQLRIVAMYFALLSFLGIVNYFVSGLFLFNTSLGTQLLSSDSITASVVLVQRMPNVIHFIIGLIILMVTKDIPRSVNPQKNYFALMVVALLLLVTVLPSAITTIQLFIWPNAGIDLISTGISFILKFAVIFLLVFFAEKRLRAIKH